MTKLKKLKNVNELYDTKADGFKPEIVPVSNDSNDAEGVGEEDNNCSALLNLSLSSSEKHLRVSDLSSSESAFKEESETCNMFTMACSSCMHPEQVVSMGARADVFSGDMYRAKASNSSSQNDAELLSPSIDSACSGRHHKRSETNHLLSACSSHESFLKVVESEETSRDLSASEDIKMVKKPNNSRAVAKSCGSFKAPIAHDSNVSHHPDKHRELECLGDNISCISESGHLKMRAGDKNCDVDRKNASCSSSSVDNFPEIEKAVNDQPDSCCFVSSPLGKVDNKHHLGSSKFSKESEQGVFCCSNKSDLSEISSLRDSCAGANSPKGEHSEVSDEQVQSLFARADATMISGQMRDENNSSGSAQIDIGINNTEQLAEGEKYSNEMEHYKKSDTVAKEANIVGSSIGSQLADCSNTSDTLEYDEIRVCDICGDVGKGYMLSICSKCNDGAEHIYCMREKLDTVPEDDWMCEECRLTAETEKQKEDKINKRLELLRKSSSGEIRQNTQNSCAIHCKSTLGSVIKSLRIEKTRTHKVNSTHPSSTKRPAAHLQGSAEKKGHLGTIFKSSTTSKSCSKTSMYPSRGDSSVSSLETVGTPVPFGGKSPKSPFQSQMSKATLSKSNSFSSTSLKEKVELSKEGNSVMKNCASITAANDNKGGVTRMVSKSLSFNNARSNGVSKNPDTKVSPSKFSSVKNLMGLRHAKEQDLTDKKGRLSYGKKDTLASMVHNKVASPGQPCLPHHPRSSDNDLASIQGSKHLSQRSFLHEKKKVDVNDIRQHVEHSKGAPANNGNDSNAHVEHSKGAPATNGNDSNAHILSAEGPHPFSMNSPWISAVPEVNYIWRGIFEVKRNDGVPSICNGIQAHISTYASCKVVEVVQKLPQKLLLEEIPRLRMWPTQFMGSHATEDNIALYFFAEGLESYRSSYRNLLDHMIYNDFALRGNFDGVELLIFSSNLLPEKRWNSLLFLWGVFRGTKVNCSEQILSSQKANISSLNVEPLKYDASRTVMSASEHLTSSEQSSQSTSMSLLSFNAQQTLNSTYIETPSSKRMVDVCETNVTSSEEKPLNSLTIANEQVDRVDSQRKSELLSGDVPYAKSSQGEERYCKKRFEFDLNHCHQEDGTYGYPVKVDEENSCKRLKHDLSATNESNSYEHVSKLADKFPSVMHDQVPSISDEFHKSEAANVQEEERDSKKRHEFNLNHCPQESRAYGADAVKVDEENGCKRLKHNHSAVNVSKSFEHVNKLADKLPSVMHDQDPSIPGEFNKSEAANMQEEERDCKKRHEIDLNHRHQEGRAYSADGVKADEEHGSKRLKYVLSGMRVCNGFGHISMLDETFPSVMPAQGPSISAEFLKTENAIMQGEEREFKKKREIDLNHCHQEGWGYGAEGISLKNDLSRINIYNNFKHINKLGDKFPPVMHGQGASICGEFGKSEGANDMSVFSAGIESAGDQNKSMECKVFSEGENRLDTHLELSLGPKRSSSPFPVMSTGKNLPIQVSRCETEASFDLSLATP